MLIAVVALDDGMAEFVNSDDILFIESKARIITIHTQDKAYKPVSRLQEFEILLEPFGFVKTHRSTLTNVDKTSGINENSENLYFKNVPKSKKSRVSKRFKKYGKL